MSVPKPVMRAYWMGTNSYELRLDHRDGERFAATFGRLYYDAEARTLSLETSVGDVKLQFPTHDE